MISLSHLSPYVERIVSEKNEVYTSTFGKELFTTANQIKRAIIKGFNEDSPEEIFFYLGERFSKRKKPFINGISIINFIKNELLKQLYVEQKFKLLIPFVDSFFEKALNSFSKGYLFNTVNSFTEEYKIFDLWKFEDYKKTHILWILELSRFILGSKQTPPEVDHKKCRMNRILKDPAFKIKFPDEKIYLQILQIHKAIHQYAKNLVFYLNSEKFMEAYFLYKSIIAESYRFLNDLDNVNFMFEMNRENIFFRSIASVAKNEASFLTVVNVRNLSIINRFYGKEIGDRILDSIQKRLTVILDLKENIFIKGISGEFYILHRKKPDNPLEFSRRLKEELESIKIKADVELKFNVVVAVLEIGGLTEIRELNRVISHAVQKAKESKSGTAFFSREQIEKEFFSEIKKIYRDVATVKKAFTEGKIDVFFQPIFNTETGKLEHLEALARIKENGNYIPAGAFIDLIYEMNLIKDLDTAVLLKTSTYMQELKKITDRVFINVSYTSISSPEFINTLIDRKKKLEEEGIEIIIELTEQSLLENIDLVKFLKEKYDLTFAVDDFGTGYSSIRTVYDLSDTGAIRYLKIDGSLIKSIHLSEKNLKPVETIVSFAKTLNLKVIAEYVENEEILKHLKKLSVDYCQGFYFSKPFHIEELTH